MAAVRDGTPSLVETGQLRHCSQSFENGSCSLDLERCDVLVAELTTRMADEHAHAGSFVRRFQALPQAEGSAQRIERRVRPALRYRYRTVRQRRYCTQRVGAKRIRQLLQFVSSASGFVDISTRKHDLEVRRQNSGAPHPIGGRIREPSDCRTCSVNSSLRQS